MSTPRWPMAQVDAASILAWVPALLLLGATSIVNAADWPQWRGPTRTGHAATSALGPEKLPKELQPKWKIAVGTGHSSPVVADGRLVYVDEKDGREIAHAVDIETGRELWQTDYAASFGDEWGSGPRATPIIDGDRVYVQACNGEFRCLRMRDGSTVWQTSFEKDFGVKFLGNKANEGTATRRGNSGSGVIDGERLVLPVGSVTGASLVCFDKMSGRVLWKSGNDEAAYSSLMSGSLAGHKQVVALNAEALLGADWNTGEIHWRIPLKTAAKRHAASPVILGDRVLVNSHTFGLICFEVRKSAAGFAAAGLWTNASLKINLATPVAVGGYLYTQGANKDYVCVDLQTGTVKWTQQGFAGGARKEYASTVVAGDRLLVLTEDGQLLLLKPDPSKYSELGRLQACGSTWSHPALAGGRLYVRDGRQLFCIEL